ncbi:MAG: hypothetical protein PHQ59_02725 [Candidatus Daviesbacteria bacterium]|nr:hypothetical protein [Candidatus Daviesbacteria bacterium]
MKNKLSVVLICDHIQRELASLKMLREQMLSENLSVSIIGSLAEVKRMYYQLYRLKPDIVFISQIQEKITRDMARYVKDCGAIVCVLPAELSYSRANLFWLYNQRLTYNELVDYYFLPGEQFLNDILEFTDIDRRKMVVVGSPKMDLLISKYKKSFLSREEFCTKYKIPLGKKNIFIYTTFAASTIDYIKKEAAFKGNVKATLRIYRCISETKKIFLKDINRICIDNPECNIIIKPHPLEDTSEYLKIKHSNYYVVQNELFNNTVSSIDLAIHWNSTVATECWIQRKKTIQYAPISKYSDLLSEFNQCNPVFENYKELDCGIKKYLGCNIDAKYLRSQKDYLKLWYYRLDGKAMNRILNILVKNIKPNKSKHYFKNYPFSFKVYSYVESLLGLSIARWLVKLVKRDFQRQYALENYILEEAK